MKPFAAIALLCLLNACASLPPPHPPVPPIPAENVPAPPRAAATLIWRPGHFDWDGRGYTWIAGQWVPRSGHGVLWQDGYWRETPDGSVWVPAHWM